MEIGRILKGVGGFYYVYYDGKVYESKATALFRKNNIKLAVGDYVEFTRNDDGTLYIKDIRPRKNLFIRPPVSNVEEVLLVISTKEPKCNYQLIDRMILLARYNGIDPKIVITKTDLDEALADKIKADYERAGFKVIKTSTKDPETIAEIKNITSEKTIMLMGVSGVGKSTLISELIGKNLETGNISQKTLRGKHTTRHVELMHYGKDSYIVDTPGFSSLAIDFVEDVYQLEDLYREFHNNFHCKFRDCLHINEPGCLVKDRVISGEIEKFRYENYLYFNKEIKNRR
ncbi:ribosome small subunit-dependent GTPase A [Neofamilia massiliensis]|uniref:ribosome small subunit-dependent GTPase A n=1 Tax=Neofamilia massiliensis TaxID=1673724 RepID=UPI0006BB8157|nr:ribosome small subunit-dependent GTPase A [Neofamilia massiliensis]